jgi:hypothetical protein
MSFLRIHGIDQAQLSQSAGTTDRTIRTSLVPQVIKGSFNKPSVAPLS